MKNAKISVIIPIYNTSQYLSRCLNSLFKQTYNNIQIIAVDDGSTDNSSDIIFKYINEYFFQKNSECDYDYVKFLFTYKSISISVYIKRSDIEKNLSQIILNLVQELSIEKNNLKKDDNILLLSNGKIENKFKINNKDKILNAGQIISEENNDCCSFSIENIPLMYVKHFENRGLFQARLTGYTFVQGEYIFSVDSDDYIGVDYLRHMLMEAVASNADVVFSSFVKVNEKNNYKGIRTQGIQAVKDYEHYDKEILEQIFKSEGELSVLWFVCGKLYKKTLWDKSYKVLSRINRHHIMLEDMMYGIVFSSNAHHYKWVDEETYFYVQNNNASTGRSGGFEKLKKNITDVDFAFEFIETYLKSIGRYFEFKRSFSLIKDKWSRTWFQIMQDYDLSDIQREELQKIILKWSQEEVLVSPSTKDVFFYDLTTPWDERIENLKKKIISEKHQIISFDIFDTLVVRPFFSPSDLFIILNEQFKTITKNRCNINFADIRKKAEKVVRMEKKVIAPQVEEITIDEIYLQIHKFIDIDEDVLDKIKQTEIDYEIKFCQPRIKIKELYDLAIFLGKKVIAVSDMYLSKNSVVQILEKCGYMHFDKIYLSSEYGLTKASGKLFSYILNDLNISGEEVIHIGDNWNTDCVSAMKFGIETWRTARPIDLLLNKVSDINHKAVRATFGELLERNSSGNFVRFMQAKDYFGIRCMLAVVANKIFDNPYMSYEPNTDFNRNPYNMGYIALGMHEYSFIRWMAELCTQKKVNAIHFVSRDGYLGKQVFDVYKKYKNNLPKSDYFYMSRKSFLSLTIDQPEDWWTIEKNINYVNKTPKEILEYYMPILDYKDEELSETLFQNGVLYEEKITCELEYIRFIQALKDLNLFSTKAKKYRTMMREFLANNIMQDDVMCDIGYSGRAQGIISKILGYGIDAFYLHTIDEKAILNEQEGNFKIYAYYGHTPAITGKMRELVQSEISGSCIGYKRINKKQIVPIIEKNEIFFHNRYVIEQIQKGTIDFIKDFMDIFAEYEHLITYRKMDASFIYEKFLLKPQNADMQVFKLFTFEDDLFFDKEYKAKKLIDIWNGDLEWENLKVASPKKPQIEKNILNNKNSESKSKDVNNAEIRKLEPYITEVNAPKGLKKKISYFKNTDHILLKKYLYRKYEGAGLYKIFNLIYNCFSNISHKQKGENAVGNKRSDYFLTSGKPILYNATSAYAVLTCMIHKLIFHPNEEAHLMLSIWRKDRIPAVQKTEFFSKIILWNDLDYRTYDYKMDKLINHGDEMDCLELEYRFFKEYEKLLPFKIKDYSKIVIHGNSMPFGCHLARNKVCYEVIEDGAGIYTKPDLLLHSISDTYPKLEQFLLKKYSIFGKNKYCICNYINYDVQSKNFDKSLTVDFKPVELLKEISLNDRKKIFDVFGVKETNHKNDKKACLFLTYPLAQREGLTHEEEKCIYTMLADIFAPECEEFHLKAHPDDRTDFSDIKDFRIINKNVLSELLWYETKTEYELAIATVSTSINNITCKKNGLAFGEEFSKNWIYMIRFFVIAKILLLNHMKNNTKICGINVYSELLREVLCKILGISIENFVENIDQADIVIVNNEKDIDGDRVCSKTIVYLEEPVLSSYKKVQINKRPIKGKYNYQNLKEEILYFSPITEIKQLEFKLQMKISDIELSISEVFS